MVHEKITHRQVQLQEIDALGGMLNFALVECPTWDQKVPGSIPGRWMRVCKYLPLLCYLCVWLLFRFVQLLSYGIE